MRTPKSNYTSCHFNYCNVICEEIDLKLNEVAVVKGGRQVKKWEFGSDFSFYFSFEYSTINRLKLRKLSKLHQSESKFLCDFYPNFQLLTQQPSPLNSATSFSSASIFSKLHQIKAFTAMIKIMYNLSSVSNFELNILSSHGCYIQCTRIKITFLTFFHCF